jgi:hypothetical protein
MHEPLVVTLMMITWLLFRGTERNEEERTSRKAETQTERL